MYNLISSNYTGLFKKYCKYQDKHIISNSLNCEDIFNDKILHFMELNIKEPTIDILKQFLKTRIKFIKYIKFCKLEFESIDHTTTKEFDELENKIKLLFIDYQRPQKIKNNKCHIFINPPKK